MQRRRLLTGLVGLFLTACGYPMAPEKPSRKAQRNAGSQPGRDEDPSPSAGESLNSRPRDELQRESDEMGSVPESQPDSSFEPGVLGDLRLALTVGHGRFPNGFERGAASRGIVEYELNLAQAETIAADLEALGAEVTILHYDEASPAINLRQRGENAAGFDIHLSLHHNAFGDASVQGGETLVDPNNNTDDDRILAGVIIDEITAATGFTNRGVKAQSLGILRGTPNSVIKCLCEPFFITSSALNPNEAMQISQNAAKAIATGVTRFWSARNNVSAFSQLAIPELRPNDLPGLYDDHNDGSI